MASSSGTTMKSTRHKTKLIKFFDRTTPIILQNDNGSSPLLAICNILLLRNNWSLSWDVAGVTQAKMLSIVTEKLIDSERMVYDDDGDEIQEQQPHQHNAVDSVPNLATGFDVKVRFRSIDDFVFTRESGVFALLDIPLYHGWIVDATDRDTINAIGSKSYNTLMREVIAFEVQNARAVLMQNTEELLRSMEATESVNRTSTDKVKEVEMTSINKQTSTESSSSAPNVVLDSSKDMAENVGETSSSSSAFNRNEGEAATSAQADDNVGTSAHGEMPVDETNVRRVELIKSFLKNNSTQLTVYGLYRLQHDIQEHQLCVFYRNNNFKTMFKLEGELYMLVTDQGYINQPDLVWEKLTEVNGGRVFINHNFKIFTADKLKMKADTSGHQLLRPDSISQVRRSYISDLRFARALQQEEFEQQQPRRASFPPGLHVGPARPATFPLGFHVGPQHGPPPRNREPEPVSSLSSKRESKQLKDKCALM